MKRIRYSLLFIAIIVLAICTVLLLNFTAPNPTGRRYSSQTIDLSLNSNEKGLQGEQILAHDLGIPPNDASDRVCICANQETPPELIACNSCLAYVQGLQHNRRPDFITDKTIIEVKNRQELLYGSDRDTIEISDYALAANALDRSLWVYVRTDTISDERFDEIVEQTGGHVVYYLAVPGYVDQVGQAAKSGLFIAITILLIAGTWELHVRRPAQPTPSVGSKSQSLVDDIDRFVEKTKAKANLKIDIEDERQGE